MAKAKHMTLDEVTEQVTGNQFKRRKVVDFGQKKNGIQFDGNGMVLVQGGKEQQITPLGVDNLVSAIDLPKVLPKKVEPELMAHILNEKAGKSGVALHPVTKGRRVVSFIEHGLTTINNDELMDAISGSFRDPMFNGVSVGQDGKCIFTVVSDQGKKLSVSKNDNFVTGVRIENNPVVAESTYIESFLERLVCLNGAIVPKAMWKSPKVINGDPETWLHDNIQQAVGESRKLFKSIKSLREQKIDDNLSDFLENIYDELKVNVKTRDLITRRIMKEGAETMYDLYNHITYVASNYRAIQDNPNLQRGLFNVSGHFAQHVEQICNSCHRPTLRTSAA